MNCIIKISGRKKNNNTLKRNFYFLVLGDRLFMVKLLKRVMFVIYLVISYIIVFECGYFFGIAITMEKFADTIKDYSTELTKAVLDYAGVPFSYKISEEVANSIDEWLWESGYYINMNDCYMLASIFAGISFALFIIGLVFGRFK